MPVVAPRLVIVPVVAPRLVILPFADPRLVRLVTLPPVAVKFEVFRLVIVPVVADKLFPTAKLPVVVIVGAFKLIALPAIATFPADAVTLPPPVTLKTLVAPEAATLLILPVLPSKIMEEEGVEVT